MSFFNGIKHPGASVGHSWLPPKLSAAVDILRDAASTAKKMHAAYTIIKRESPAVEAKLKAPVPLAARLGITENPKAPLHQRVAKTVQAITFGMPQMTTSGDRVADDQIARLTSTEPNDRRAAVYQLDESFSTGRWEDGFNTPENYTKRLAITLALIGDIGDADSRTHSHIVNLVKGMWFSSLTAEGRGAAAQKFASLIPTQDPTTGLSDRDFKRLLIALNGLGDLLSSLPKTPTSEDNPIGYPTLSRLIIHLLWLHRDHPHALVRYAASEALAENEYKIRELFPELDGRTLHALIHGEKSAAERSITAGLLGALLKSGH